MVFQFICPTELRGFSLGSGSFRECFAGNLEENASFFMFVWRTRAKRVPAYTIKPNCGPAFVTPILCHFPFFPSVDFSGDFCPSLKFFVRAGID